MLFIEDHPNNCSTAGPREPWTGDQHNCLGARKELFLIRIAYLAAAVNLRSLKPRKLEGKLQCEGLPLSKPFLLLEVLL